jgi:acyl-CoA reductase-like NAD-dependent aldehyde dehydrogenase
MTTTVDLPSLESQLFIGGRWSDTTEHHSVISPATGAVIGSVAQGTPADVDAAVYAAAVAFPAWAGLTVFDRAAALRRLAAIVTDRRDEIALLLALEQGKPLHAEAYGEVDVLVRYLQEAGEDAKRLTGSWLPSQDPANRVIVARVPRGIVGTIQPWNYPLETMGIQVAPALACGDTVVCVPAPSTSLVAHAFAGCVQAAELPPGVFNLVTGAGPVVGDALAGHPGINAIVFTGSTATGNHIARRAAGKPQILELGGNGPFIVLDDADLDLVIPALVTSSFYCAGQMCTAAERVLVQDGIYDELAARLAATVTNDIVLGHTLEPDTVIGPLNNAKVAAKMDQHVADAVAKGATVLTGGSRGEGFPTDLYWQPTVLTDINDTMLVTQEETFGPIAPLERITDEQHALRIMNQSSYGLACAIFTRDVGRGLVFAERAPAGTVIINEYSAYLETHVPFGGAAGKSSGFGRAHGAAAMEQVFTDTKTIVMHLS